MVSLDITDLTALTQGSQEGSVVYVRNQTYLVEGYDIIGYQARVEQKNVFFRLYLFLKPSLTAQGRQRNLWYFRTYCIIFKLILFWLFSLVAGIILQWFMLSQGLGQCLAQSRHWEKINQYLLYLFELKFNFVTSSIDQCWLVCAIDCCSLTLESVLIWCVASQADHLSSLSTSSSTPYGSRWTSFISPYFQ